MPIRFFTGKKRRPPSKVVRPTRARDEALQRQMAKAFSANWKNGVTRLRQGVSSDVLADAYMRRDYAAITKNIKFGSFKQYLKAAMSDIAQATEEGAQRGAAFVVQPEKLRYDLSNPRIREYMSTRQGALIEGVTDEFQLTVQHLIKTNFARGGSVEGMQAGLLTAVERNGVAGFVLKNSIGLDVRSSNALAARAASGKYTQAQLDAYESTLHERRALLIANTETSYALNEGQRAVWAAAQEQGLISEESRKVWVVDGRPCPLCIAMDGISVALGEMFLSPDGVEVDGPPLHPRCQCVCQLDVQGDGDNIGGSNRQNYA